MKIIRSWGLDSEIKPPKSFRLFFRTEANDGATEVIHSLLLEMPSTDFEFIRGVEVPGGCTPHGHGHGDGDGGDVRFRRISIEAQYLTHTSGFVYQSTWPVVTVGSVVYVKYYLPETQTIRFQSIHVNTGAITELPPPITPRCFSEALSLRGKVFLFGGFAFRPELRGYHYGEVFDPKNETWFPLKLPSPPEDYLIATGYNNFIASLGEKEGKFMIYCPNPDATLYIYDVARNEWEFRPCAALDMVSVPRSMMGQPVINEDDGYLYWFLQNALIYAFDWQNMRLYSGSIVGLENEGSFKVLQSFCYGVTLHHLWGEFFCLLWTDYFDTPSGKGNGTNYHFTFLRVITDSSTQSLTAYVLGCFMDSFDRRCDIYDAIRV